MKTERVTLLISPDDKRKLQNMAEDRGITTSELVRQAVQAYRVSSIEETRELAALTSALRASIAPMRKRLREANAAAERAIEMISRHQTSPRRAASRSRVR
jgi:hypothetical protein